VIFIAFKLVAAFFIVVAC